MDFKKTHGGVQHQLSIDPSGIDICGNGHVNVNVHTRNMSINMDTIDISGNIKFDDTHLHETWFGPDLRGGVDISDGGWVMMKNKPPGPNDFDEYTSESNTINFTQDSGIEGFEGHFSRPTSELTFTPDEILFTSIASDGQRVWWILDYTIATNVSSSSSAWSVDGTFLVSTTVIKASSSNVSHITHVYSWDNAENIFSRAVYFNEGTINPPEWLVLPHPQLNNSSASQFPVYRASGTLDSSESNHSFLYHQGMSIFFRDSTNIQANPKPYPTLIKKEPEHLHITAPLNIYPEGDYELDKLGFDGNINLTYDNYLGSSNNGITIDNNGGWYIVRQSYNPTHPHYDDNFHFGINHGTLDINNLSAGDFYSRNVSNYDYDEVLFWGEGNKWLIFDRTLLESFKSLSDAGGTNQIGVKKSSVSATQHLIYSNPTVANHRPHIFYSNTDGTLDNTNNGSNRLDWTEYDAGIVTNNNWGYMAGERKYYVRRSDGQPVRLKNKVKVDVDGNLDVDGTINGIITTANGNIGIGTTSPKALLNTNNVMTANNNTIRPSNSGDTVYETESLWLGKSYTTSNYWGMSLGTTWTGHGYIQCLNTRTSDYYHLYLNPKGGNVGIGTTSPGALLDVVNSDDSGIAEIRAMGVNQGTGKVYVGQKYNTGGGIIYQGDNTPSVISGSSSDEICLFRRESGTDYAVLRFPYNSNDITATGSVASGAWFTAKHGFYYSKDRSNHKNMRIGHWYGAASESESRITNSTNLHIDCASGAGTYINNYSGGTTFTKALDTQNYNIEAGSGKVYAKGFHADGSNPFGNSGTLYGWLQEDGTTMSQRWNSNGQGGKPRSAYFEHYLACQGVMGRSDSRIKKNIKEIVTTEYFLDLIKNIQITEYDYIYKENGDHAYGYIAQQVKKHYPDAIELGFGFLPDEQRYIENTLLQKYEDGEKIKWKLIIQNLKFEDNHTGICKFYCSNNKDEDPICLKINIEPDNKTVIFNEKYENIYFYGKEVNDFHYIDKNKIYNLHHGAIQELYKEIINIKNDKPYSLYLLIADNCLNYTHVNNCSIIINETIFDNINKKNIINRINKEYEINHTNEIFTIIKLNNKYYLKEINNNFNLNYKHYLTNSYKIKDGMTGVLETYNDNNKFKLDFIINNNYELLLSNKKNDHIKIDDLIKNSFKISYLCDSIPCIENSSINLINNMLKLYDTNKYNELKKEYTVLKNNYEHLISNANLQN